MPNGRPGDHPLTDILLYGLSNFPDDIKKTVIRLATLPRFKEVRERVAAILLENEYATANFVKLREALKQIESEIE